MALDVASKAAIQAGYDALRAALVVQYPAALLGLDGIGDVRVDANGKITRFEVNVSLRVTDPDGLPAAIHKTLDLWA